MHPQDKEGMTQGIRDEKEKKIGERWSISAESINVYFPAHHGIGNMQSLTQKKMVSCWIGGRQLLK